MSHLFVHNPCALQVEVKTEHECMRMIQLYTTLVYQISKESIVEHQYCKMEYNSTHQSVLQISATIIIKNE